MDICFSFAKTILMLNTNRKVTLLILTVLRLSGSRATFSKHLKLSSPPHRLVSWRQVSELNTAATAVHSAGL